MEPIQIKPIANGYIVSKYHPPTRENNVAVPHTPGHLEEWYCWSIQEVQEKLANLL